MRYSPDEIREGEIFVGNVRCDPYVPKPYLQTLKTIRLGNQAHDVTGLKLPLDMYKPMFIDKSEFDLYNKIMDNLNR